MTYTEILEAHKAGKILAGLSREDAVDCDVLAFDTEAEAEAYCRNAFTDTDDIRVTGVDETDMEVTDPDGYYSGSGRRYSLIPMMYPVVEIDE